ncbi:hypothetical protein JTE90_002937 [Oedothorax gibbosus]|uniref:Uncharacterized protein n=1 Tax=Oedothorax gibbosus TaxID=931172 RepID=A0AAV6UVR7_9ARAC|nr:hypothetical protein JTE90_002937 [Oedothorax gibbosus]
MDPKAIARHFQSTPLQKPERIQTKKSWEDFKEGSIWPSNKCSMEDRSKSISFCSSELISTICLLSQETHLKKTQRGCSQGYIPRKPQCSSSLRRSCEK